MEDDLTHSNIDDSGSITNPHDRLFKETFCHVEDLLSLLPLALSKENYEMLDTSTLRQLDTSFITKHLKEYQADLLFECKCRDSDESVLICLLLEHKSHPDEMVLIQFFLYIALLWNKCREERKKITDIPVVIPIVFYTGDKPWHFKSLREIFAKSKLKNYFPDLPIAFFDLTHCSSEELAKGMPNSLILYFWKKLIGKELQAKDLIATICEMEKKKPDASSLQRRIEALLAYIENTNRRLADEIQSDLEEEGKMSSWILNNLVERGRIEGEKRGLIEGEKRGRIEGEKQGLIEGEKRGREDAILAMLRNIMDREKWSAEKAMNFLGIPEGEQEQLAKAI